jgi:hypothetical protein
MSNILNFFKSKIAFLIQCFRIATNKDHILIHTEDNSLLKELNDATQIILETHLAEDLHLVSGHFFPFNIMSHSAFNRFKNCF